MLLESRRKYFADKYHWLRENHPEYWIWGEDYQYGIGFLDQLKAHNFQSILDVGCGSGNFCRLAKDSNETTIVCGMDIVDAVSAPRDGIVFDFGCSAHNMPYEDNQFDAITSFDVMEHMIEEDVPIVLDEMFRVASKQVFLTICHRSSFCFRDEIGELHATAHERDWWDQQLLRYCKKDYYHNQCREDAVFWSIVV